MKALTYLLSVLGLSMVLSSPKVRAGLSSMAELLTSAVTPVAVPGNYYPPTPPKGPEAVGNKQAPGLELPDEAAVEGGELPTVKKSIEPTAKPQEAPLNGLAEDKEEETDSDRLIKVLEIYERGEDSEKSSGGS